MKLSPDEFKRMQDLEKRAGEEPVPPPHTQESKTEGTPEQDDIRFIPNEFIENGIIDFFQAQEKVSVIEKKVSGNGNQIFLYIKILEEGGFANAYIDIELTLDNDGNTISVKNPTAKTGLLGRARAKSIIPKIGKVPEALRNYIETVEEKRTGQKAKIKRVRIVNGEIEATFESTNQSSNLEKELRDVRAEIATLQTEQHRTANKIPPIEEPQVPPMAEEVVGEKVYRDALRVILEGKLISIDTQTLSRALGLKYIPAREIIDEMAREGIVSTRDGFGGARVLLTPTEIRAIMDVAQIKNFATEEPEDKIVYCCRACGRGLTQESAREKNGAMYCAEHVPLSSTSTPEATPAKPTAEEIRGRLDLNRREIQKNETERIIDEESIRKLNRKLERLKADRPRREALEEDRKINPFKYFLVKQMSREIFRLIFRKEKEEVSLEELNKYMGKDGKLIEHLTFTYIVPSNHYATEMSTNGFFLQLENIDEVEMLAEDKPDRKSGKARYKLIRPDFTHTLHSLTYEDGMAEMILAANDYLKVKELEFKNLKK